MLTLSVSLAVRDCMVCWQLVWCVLFYCVRTVHLYDYVAHVCIGRDDMHHEAFGKWIRTSGNAPQ